MAVLSWGKPTVEFIKSTEVQPNAKWEKMPEIVEGTAILETTEGELIEATEEGGAVVDSRRKANKYKFSCEVFVKKDDTSRPIPDTNGIIADNYAVRMTPEDAACEGFLIGKSNVTVIESWSAADGKRLKYIFDAIKPTSGILCEPYTKSSTQS
jgi:hypothetical protein